MKRSIFYSFHSNLFSLKIAVIILILFYRRNIEEDIQPEIMIFERLAEY